MGSMLIIPSLYIQKGRCVSLYKGHENDQKKTYNRSPLNIAIEFQKQGAKEIQLVDMDGVQQGVMVNMKTIEQCLERLKTSIQVAGQIRTLEEVQHLFDLGVKRVILGVSARNLIPEAIRKYGEERIIFGIKARREWVESDSLPEESDEVIEMAEAMVRKGIKQIIYNDMERQGTLYHPNYDDVDRLITYLDPTVKVYSSGGVTALDDFRILKSIGTYGVLVSRAFVEHKINLSEAVKFTGAEDKDG